MEMNTQEAIGRIKNDIRLHHEELSGQYRHALRMAIVALKEQIPIKPIYKSDMPFCGRCKYALSSSWHNCPNCGKEIHWNG